MVPLTVHFQSNWLRFKNHQLVVAMMASWEEKFNESQKEKESVQNKYLSMQMQYESLQQEFEEYKKEKAMNPTNAKGLYHSLCVFLSLTNMVP